MHFKLDVMKTVDADNAFSWHSASSVPLSRSQLPWNEREITAENLGKLGSWYKTLEHIIHIIDMPF